MSKKLRNIIREMRKKKNPRRKYRGKGAAGKPKQMRMNSQEFLEIYDKLWKEGPIVKYQNPDSWVELDPRPEK